MSNEDLNDMISSAKVEPTTDAVNHILDICRALNERIETLRQELLMEKRWRASILRGQGGHNP